MAGAYHNVDATVAARDAVPVVTSDVTVIPVTRSLYIGTSGTLVVRMAGAVGGAAAASVTFTNVPVGVHPVQVDQVLASGTTASGILALY
jgi:hypothetical protein